MKKVLAIATMAACLFVTSSCKKENVFCVQTADDQNEISKNKPNCFSTCPQPVGTATVALSTVIGQVNHLPKVRLAIFYYYQSSKKGRFSVTIKNQSQTIILGQIFVNNVPASPIDGSPGMVEKDFAFPVALNSYSGYALVVNGQSDCNHACSSFTGYFIPW